MIPDCSDDDRGGELTWLYGARPDDEPAIVELPVDPEIARLMGQLRVALRNRRVRREPDWDWTRPTDN